MKKLLVFMKDYKKEAVAAPVFKLLEASFELLVPLVVADIIDKGINAPGGGDSGYIALMCLLMVGLGVVGLASTVAAQYFAAKASAGFVRGIRDALFRHINSLSFAQTDAMGTSTLITRMTSDANQVQTGMNLTLRLLLRSPFIVLGAAIMAFTVDAKAALVFAVAIPLLAVVIFAIMLACLPMYKKVQQRLDKVVLSIRENLAGVRVLRAFCLEDKEIHAFREKNGALAADQRRTGRIAALLNPLTFVIINLGIVWLIYSGALRVEAGLLTQGAVIALYNYMSQILVELIKFANLIINITKALACAKRIETVLQTQPQQIQTDIPAQPSGEAPAVEFRAATLVYSANGSDAAARQESGGAAVQNITLSVKRGEHIGIIGPTGSGKSTLMSLITRFYDCTSGQVLVEGVPVEDYPAQQLTQRIALVPQRATLFTGTVRENLLWGRKDATDEELMQALELACAKDFVMEKGGLDFAVTAGGRNLSGGQRQRLTIARAIVRRADIMILDDSYSALDNLTDARVRLAVNSLGATVFTVSQRTRSVQNCDRILVLDNGEAVGLGDHETLLRSCAVYREIYQSQEAAKA
jgi:hypothetical protein